MLLAAGSGERLRPETASRPKALVEVGGRPLLAHALAALEACGVERAVVVTGHGREGILEFLAEWPGAISVEERPSPRFATTNNVVSLACAADLLLEGAWIVETDVVAELSAWRLLAASAGGDARWLAAPFGAGHDGALLVADAGGRLRDWRLRSKGSEPMPGGAFKSMGILVISPAFGARLVARLAIAAAQGRDRIYFDEVVVERLESDDIRVVDAGASRWMEIDTLEDLAEARRLFDRTGRLS